MSTELISSDGLVTVKFQFENESCTRILVCAYTVEKEHLEITGTVKTEISQLLSALKAYLVKIQDNLLKDQPLTEDFTMPSFKLSPTSSPKLIPARNKAEFDLSLDLFRFSSNVILVLDVTVIDNFLDQK